MRVLIAEDDLISRKILSKFLAPYGETVLAAHGDEALKLYEEAQSSGAPFDVILLDMMMPHKHGLEVLEIIRRKEREAGTASSVPILMLTGQGDAIQINQAKTLGISDYMLKPVDEMKLIRELQRLELITDPQDQWK